MSKKILIVDDEPDIRELLEMTITNLGYECICAENFTLGLEYLKKDKFVLCLTDMRLPDGDGINLVRYIQKAKPELPVAVITAYGNVEDAVNTLKAGAFDYVSKPIRLDVLKKLINSAVNLKPQFNTEVSQQTDFVGDSPIIIKLLKDLAKFARSQAPVFIHGESGVGKELVAKMIHNNGSRANNPFVPVNCGAIPSELMESEFFGHKKGSFTGATKEHQGLFQAAHGGTLFLDEIAELPIHMQVKLLRAIQEKAIKPIGANTEINIDVRILSATHKNLLNEIQNDQFRQDLYYRINVIELRVPSLLEHKEDIPILVDTLLNRFEYHKKLPKVSTSAMAALKQYSFPGNVRELENILERALALCENAVINVEDLQLPQIENNNSDENQESLNNENDPLDDFLEEQQREAIIEALNETKWNRTAAAKLLGISFRALRYRLKKLNIE